MSTTRSSLSACSSPPSRSWPASARSSPTRATTPSTIVASAASSAPSHRFTSVVARTDPDWASAAGRSSAAMPGCWRTSASPYATTGSTSSCSRCFRPLAYSWLQAASPDNSENRLYEPTGAAIHVIRYAGAVAVCPGKRVLDVACGEGYGSFLMAQAGAGEVIGLDVSAEAVAAAARQFPHPRLRFLAGDAANMDSLLGDSQFDLIVSL